MAAGTSGLDVQEAETLVPGWGPTLHLRVRRVSGKGPIPWEALQAIKDERAGPDATAIEVYPPASEVIDEVEMRHLWIVPPGVPMPSLARR